MDFNEFKTTILATVPENDSNRASKQLHLKNWCSAFYEMLFLDKENSISFFLDIISDEECWEETNTIHRIKFNRRVAAKKMVQPLSPKGVPTPLDESDRYKIACYCCLEEYAAVLFQNYKQINNIRSADEARLKKILQIISKDFSADPLMNYWSHIAGGCVSELQSGSKHLYEHGLNLTLSAYVLYLEAVEFFWTKINALSNDELSAKQKNEIFLKAAITATKMRFRRNPEVFEFCLLQMIPSSYRYFLRKVDFVENDEFGSLAVLRDNFSFDLYQKLFDCLRPHDIGKFEFWEQLTLLEIEEYPEYYVNEAVKLFMHIWMKNGFDGHRRYALINEMMDHRYRGNLLIPFVKKNYMEPVWAMMDQADLVEINVFMNCDKAFYIRSVLEERGDENSLRKFLSYQRAFEEVRKTHDLFDLTHGEKENPPQKRAKAQ